MGAEVGWHAPGASFLVVHPAVYDAMKPMMDGTSDSAHRRRKDYADIWHRCRVRRDLVTHVYPSHWCHNAMWRVRGR